MSFSLTNCFTRLSDGRVIISLLVLPIHLMFSCHLVVALAVVNKPLPLVLAFSVKLSGDQLLNFTLLFSTLTETGIVVRPWVKNSFIRPFCTPRPMCYILNVSDLVNLQILWTRPPKFYDSCLRCALWCQVLASRVFFLCITRPLLLMSCFVRPLVVVGFTTQRIPSAKSKPTLRAQRRSRDQQCACI